MASRVAEPQPGGGDRPVRGPLRALLKRQIIAGRSSPVPRDPDLIRRRLPAIACYTGYFTPEVRGLDRVPADGPALLVGNHSCLFYMPEVWTAAQAVMSRRGVDAPTYALAYDLLFAVPGIAAMLRRLGAVPADIAEAETALAGGACVLVYPGGDLEACRTYTQRGRVDFAGRTGFVRLALCSGVPVVPVVVHGAHHAVVVLARGDRLARVAGLRSLRINVFPLLAAPRTANRRPRRGRSPTSRSGRTARWPSAGRAATVRGSTAPFAASTNLENDSINSTAAYASGSDRVIAIPTPSPANAARHPDRAISVRRRSHRSMNTPANGPTTLYGSSVAARTPAMRPGVAPRPISKTASCANAIWASPSPA